VSLIGTDIRFAENAVMLPMFRHDYGRRRREIWPTVDLQDRI